MPLYSYHCAACDADSEILMRSDETATCPDCGSDKMERLPSWLAPDLKSDKIRKSWRAKAAREGDASNFSSKERGTFKK
jgi:putative FmdB family regulatory protein